MQEIVLESHSHNLSIDDVVSYVSQVVNDFATEYAMLRIPGAKSSDDIEYRHVALTSQRWIGDYKRVGRLFFENRATGISGSMGLQDGFFQITFVARDRHFATETLAHHFEAVVSITQPQLAYMFLQGEKSKEIFDYSYGAHEEGLGIRAGLRDVYWLNFFGQPFVDSIGLERLRSVQATDCKLYEFGVYLRITEDIADAFNARERAKSTIGKEHFVPESAPASPGKSGGLLTLVGIILGQRRARADLRTAECPPQFFD